MHVGRCGTVSQVGRSRSVLYLVHMVKCMHACNVKLLMSRSGGMLYLPWCIIVQYGIACMLELVMN